MSNIWGIYLIGTLVRGALVVVVLFGLEAVLRRKLLFSGGRWFYAGLLALMLLPVGMVHFNPAEPGSTAALSEPPSAEKMEQEDVAMLPAFSGAAAPRTQNAAAGSEAPVVAGGAAQEPPDAAILSALTMRTPFNWVAALWICYGVIVSGLLARQLGQFLCWRRKIRRCGAITGGRVYDLFCQAKVQTGMEKRRIELRDGSAVSGSPACFGSVLSECLLCPLDEMERLSDAEIRMLLIHELGHLRSFDNLASSMFRVAGGFLFFNVFWRVLARRAMTVRELDCDAFVIRLLGMEPAGRVAYARLLLVFQLKANCAPGAALGATARELKLRIGEIGMKKRKYQNIAVTALLALFAGMSLLSPACTSLSEPEKRPDTVMDSARLILPYLPGATNQVFGFEHGAIARLYEYPGIANDLLSMGRWGAELAAPGDVWYIAGQGGVVRAVAVLLTDRPLDKLAADSGCAVTVIDSDTRELKGRFNLRLRQAAAGVFVMYRPDYEYVPGPVMPELERHLKELSGDASAFAVVTTNMFSAQGERSLFSGTLDGDEVLLVCKPMSDDIEKRFSELESKTAFDELQNSLSAGGIPVRIDQIKVDKDIGTIKLTLLPPPSREQRVARLMEKYEQNLSYYNGLFDRMRDLGTLQSIVSAGGTPDLLKLADECEMALLDNTAPPLDYSEAYRQDKADEKPERKQALTERLLISDIAIIDRGLNRVPELIATYRRLADKNPEAAQRCFYVVRNDLFDAGEWELASRFCPDPLAYYLDIEKNTVCYANRAGRAFPRFHYPRLESLGNGLAKVAEYQGKAGDAEIIRRHLADCGALVEASSKSKTSVVELLQYIPADAVQVVAGNYEWSRMMVSLLDQPFSLSKPVAGFQEGGWDHCAAALNSGDWVMVARIPGMSLDGMNVIFPPDSGSEWAQVAAGVFRCAPKGAALSGYGYKSFRAEIPADATGFCMNSEAAIWITPPPDDSINIDAKPGSATAGIIAKKVAELESALKGNGIEIRETPGAFQVKTKASDVARCMLERDIWGPRVAMLYPANGATGVDPNLTGISVTFNRRMLDNSWSFFTGDGNSPDFTGHPSYDKDCLTVTAPVKLKPNTTYTVWLNSAEYKNFRGADGYWLAPFKWTFTTGE